ncbi:MAG: cobalt transporter CbiM [Chloroflexota bacterium]|nr:MAG: cobalt transporter CbiM [Chloroflexota bacterium]
MHIPDGYLSPQTCAVMGAGMVPVWYAASRRVEKKLPSHHVPLLALSAAFAFVVQMFNIPIPDGTTAHVVGGVLIAVVLGPWAAVIAMSITLAIQSLFFGDGGITAIGANAFNIAFIGPFVGYAVYRVLASGKNASASRRMVAAGVGAFFGTNAAGLLTAIELGLQPLLFKSATGVPLYSPYGVEQAVPAIMAAHLFIVGPLEAVITALAVGYAQRVNLGQPVARTRQARESRVARDGGRRWLWITTAIILLLVVASPIGSLASGTAWGEWGAQDLGDALGYVPEGLESASGLWTGPLTDYNVPGWESAASSRLGYLISALVGLVIVGGVALILGKVLAARSQNVTQPQVTSAVTRRSVLNTGTPEWLLHGTAPGPCRCSTLSRPAKGSFLEKTIGDGLNLLRNTMFSEEVARSRGFLQRCDPRIKVVTLLGLLVVAAFVTQLLPLAILYVVGLVLAWASAIPLGFFVKRVWLFIPLFTGVMVLPALFNVITPGQPLLVLADWGQPLSVGPLTLPSYLAITHQGLLGAVVLVSRVAVSISLAVLLTLTTRWSDLLKALRSLGIPRIIVLMLAMAYRYLYVLLESASELLVARKSRQIGPLSDHGEGRRFLAGSMAVLLGKSYGMSEEVYAAMVSRGFNGEVRTMDELKMTRVDLVWGVLALLIALSLAGGGYVLGT